VFLCYVWLIKKVKKQILFFGVFTQALARVDVGSCFYRVNAERRYGMFDKKRLNVHWIDVQKFI